MGQNYTGYWLLPEVMSEDRRTDTAPITESLLITCEDGWPQGVALGAEPVRGAAARASQLWVMPGQLQDDLARDGQLG